MSDYPRAVVREVNGQLVLDDPDALAMLQVIARHNEAIGKQNCQDTLALNAERVEHFKKRIIEKGLTTQDVVIVILNVDDRFGGPLAHHLMPGCEEMWQSFRDQGQVPFARGLVTRDGVQDMLDFLQKETGDDGGEKLRRAKGVAVVVMDHGVREVFESPIDSNAWTKILLDPPV